jgi:hypothetical protein
MAILRAGDLSGLEPAVRRAMMRKDALVKQARAFGFFKP